MQRNYQILYERIECRQHGIATGLREGEGVNGKTLDEGAGTNFPL